MYLICVIQTLTHQHHTCPPPPDTAPTVGVPTDMLYGEECHCSCPSHLHNKDGTVKWLYTVSSAFAA